MMGLENRPRGQASETGAPDELGRVDPLELLLAHPAGAPAVAAAPPPITSTGFAASLAVAPAEVALSGLVRRVVWGGDRRRGVARIELDGAFAGTSIWLSGEGRALELEVALGPGLEGRGLAERLLARLGARGIAVARCEVR